jgi:nascent polypeptide-associated complex subunit beta
MEDEETMLAARQKLAARFGDSSRTGGKGSVRRKKKMVHKNPLGDDKKLKSALKRLNVQNMPAIEEVNMFMHDNTVMHFTNPGVQAAVKDNLFVITGAPETKQL